MTKVKSERIARFAFDFAVKNGRKVRFFLGLTVIVSLGEADMNNLGRIESHLRSQSQHYEIR
jgi:hypothetical protein